MKLEVGRMDKLGIKPGDVIECVSAEGCFTNGKKYKVNGDGQICDDDGYLWPLKHTGCYPSSKFKIVTDAPQPAGPVRMVKRIVPGVYGSVTVFANQNSVIIEMDNRMVWCADNIQNLRAAIATLSEIADAMEENSK